MAIRASDPDEPSVAEVLVAEASVAEAPAAVAAEDVRR